MYVSNQAMIWKMKRSGTKLRELRYFWRYLPMNLWEGRDLTYMKDIQGEDMR